MRVETITLRRGGGKSYYLAERVAEVQDTGAELAVIIVPNAGHVDYWFDFIFDVGIDPSRFMVLPAQQIDKLRGLRATVVGLDNVDLMDVHWMDLANHFDPLQERLTLTRSV